MDSKRLGMIGEAEVIAEFVKNQIPIYLPFGDNERCDLIAEFNGKLNKIQIKTSEKTSNGTITFELSSRRNNLTSSKKVRYSEEEIDYFALYNLERDSIYLIKIQDAPKETITFRFEETKNNQVKGIRMESDYLFEKVIMPADPDG
ncbi:MAG: group I intron-associated PD-(D/E)XK endonuclease [Bacteroidia bacterium]|nr:group I intron-associated PD-(D/E)XK endonuclease [Bacteroidia bacterium]